MIVLASIDGVRVEAMQWYGLCDIDDKFIDMTFDYTHLFYKWFVPRMFDQKVLFVSQDIHFIDDDNLRVMEPGDWAIARTGKPIDFCTDAEFFKSYELEGYNIDGFARLQNTRKMRTTLLENASQTGIGSKKKSALPNRREDGQILLL